MVGDLAEVTVEGGAGDDGRGHDDKAEHDEAVDEEVLETVPPAKVRGQTSSLGVEMTQSYGGATVVSPSPIDQIWTDFEEKKFRRKELFFG